MFEINDVLNKSDLVVYVERAGGKLEKTGNRYSCACPLHGGENETGFSVYFDKGKWKWHCFTDACGSGDAVSFIESWVYRKEPDKNKRFKLACEWITGANINDVPAMHISAQEREEEARIEAVAAKERHEARIKELQVSARHLEYHQTRKQWAIDMWAARGLDEGMQDFFTLGACDDFSYWIKDVEYHSPTLSIPYLGRQGELLNLQHRLVNPKSYKDKYRPDIKGAGPMPYYLAIPDLGFDGELIVVVEGAIKSAVTWSRIEDGEVQVIGTPTQGGYDGLAEKLKGKKPIIIPDPNGNSNENVLQKPYDLARNTGGTILTLPGKIDDYLNVTGITGNEFHKILKQARVP